MADAAPKLSKQDKKLVALATQEATRIAKYGKNLTYCAATLPCMQNDQMVDLPDEALFGAAKAFSKRAPETGLLLIAAGATRLQLYVGIPDARLARDPIKVEAWLKAAYPAFDCEDVADQPYVWSAPIGEGDGFKLGDVCKNRAVAYLQANALWPADDDSD